MSEMFLCSTLKLLYLFLLDTQFRRNTKKKEVHGFVSVFEHLHSEIRKVNV